MSDVSSQTVMEVELIYSWQVADAVGLLPYAVDNRLQLTNNVADVVFASGSMHIRDVHLSIYGFTVFMALRCNLMQIAVLADVNSKIDPYCCATVYRTSSASSCAHRQMQLVGWTTAAWLHLTTEPCCLHTRNTTQPGSP